MSEDWEYESIVRPDSQPSFQRPTKRRLCSISHWLQNLVLVAAGVAAFVLGLSCFFLGKYVGKRECSSDWLTPSGEMVVMFQYEKVFAMRPTNQSRAHWNAMFPSGRGFVQHPEISPEPQGISLFHQLHCLDAIHRAYWLAVDRIGSDQHTAPGHVRHCIDYLRQSLLCHADTNLEPIDSNLGGVTGFGSVRKCRDASRVVEWANAWRTHNQTDTT